MRARIGKVSATLCFAIGVGAAVPAMAAYPDRPVHFLVGYAPGGGIDTVTRTIAAKLSEKWGQPIIVDNRPGADGTSATETVAHATPDGYSVAWINEAYTITPSEYKLSYDPIKSLIPVTEVAYGPGVLLLNPVIPVSTLGEFVAYGKAHPDKVTAGAASGPAGTPYLQMKMLLDQLGVKSAIAPFTGGGPVMAALLGNEIQITFTSVAIAAEQIKAGKVKALAVSSGVRSPKLPDVPTVAEAGPLPGYDASTWYGVMVPAGTSKEIVQKLHDDITAIARLPDVQERLANNGFVTIGSTSEQFAKEIDSEIARWAAVLKTVNGK